VTISNTAPVVSGVSIAPSSPTVSDTLDCSTTFFDADGDADATTIEWTDDSGTALGTGASLSGAFANGDEVTCTVTPTDDEESGTPESASVTIGNSAPSVTDVSISPAGPLDNDTLTCSWIFADDDGDADASTVEWTDGSGTSLGSGTTLSSGFIAGDDITCTVTADDGSDTGNTGSDTVSIGSSNTAPSVSNVTVLSTTDADGDADSATAIAADALECTWTFSDPQGDSDNSTVEWTDGAGTSLGTGSTYSGAFVGGDTITCTVTPNDGTIDGTPDSGSITIDNTTPTVISVTVLATTDADGDMDGTTAIAADTLECSWTFYDADGDVDSSTIEWTDDSGTSLGTGTTLSYDPVNFVNFVGDDTITCTVTPNDGTVDGTPDSGSITIGNTAPTVTGVSVGATTDADGDMDSTTAIAADTLYCNWTYDDVDGDTETSSVEWTDGSGTSLYTEVTDSTTSATLSGAFSDGDTITCTVTPNDGTVDGTPDSASITIGNTAPTVTSVTVLATTNADGDTDSTTAIAADTLECSWVFYDVDGGSDTSSVEWTDGSGTTLGTSTTLSGGFVGGDTVICTVTPNDGTIDGTPDSASITIGNTAPTVTSVTVLATTNADGDTDSTTANGNDELTCLWTFDDVDGDGDVSTVEWTDGSGTSLGTSTTLSGLFSGGDIITCTVTPNDGTIAGTPDSASIGIDNTPPTVTGVTVLAITNADGDMDDTTANPDDTLECSWTFDDPEGDGDNSTVQWTDDSGTILGTGTTLSDTPWPTWASGDTITCTVTPNDGTLNGTPDSGSITLGNTAPTVSGVSVLAVSNMDGDGDPTTAIAADYLECVWSFYDADGDSVSFTVEWSDSSGVLATGPDSEFYGPFFKDQYITCTVTPNDGFEDGAPDSGSIIILNTPPVLWCVAIEAYTNEDGDGDPATAVDTDTLECLFEACFEDADGDMESGSTYEWQDGSGNVIGTSDFQMGGLVAGDTVSCVVTPFDGTDFGMPMGADIYIGSSNTAPPQPTVEIFPTAPLTGDTLVCEVTNQPPDADGDVVDYSFVWTYDDGQGGPPQTATSGMLSTTYFADDTVNWVETFVDQTWTCTATPYDGTEYGAPDSASTVIDNTAPTQPTVQITPTSPLEGEELLCSVTVDSTDADGDSVDYSFEWTYDDGQGSSGTASGGMLTTTVYTDDTVVAGETFVDETWTCTVTPNDGTDDGLAGSDTVGPLQQACPNGWDWDNDGVFDVCSEPVLFAPLNSSGEDISPSAHGVTNTGVTEATDRCGTSNAAMDFNGSSYLSFPDSSDFAFGSGDYTISLWAKTDVIADRTLMAQWNHPIWASGGGDDAFVLTHSACCTGTTVVTHTITANGVDDDHVLGDPMSTTDWHHVVVLVESGTTEIFFDGVLAATGSQGSVWDSIYNLTIGSIHDGNSGWEGQIDDVAIWKEALSQAEVAALFAADCWDDADADGITADLDCDDYDPAVFQCNTAPTQPTVQVTPTSPLEGEELLCSVTVDSTDADGDSVDYSFEWTYDDGQGGSGTASGAMLTTTVYTDDTVVAGETFVDETWTCTVTPNDGTDDGIAGEDSVLVETPACWSLDFDGSDEIVVSSSSEIAFGQQSGMQRTIEFWMKTSYTGMNQMVLLSKASAQGSTYTDYAISYDDQLIYYWVGSSSTAQIQAPYPLDGNWHHLAATLDMSTATTGTIELYIDGISVSQMSITGKVVSTTDPLIVGRYTGLTNV
jgi:hypothetical protein